jgi:tetratricopeptide (TPR) repeat protein
VRPRVNGIAVIAAEKWIELKSAHFTVTSITMNTRDAWAHASLGEVRSQRGSADDPMGVVRRALALEPGEAYHHLRAATVLWRQKKYDEALVQAQAARDLADDEQVRRRAAEMMDGISRARR